MTSLQKLDSKGYYNPCPGFCQLRFGADLRKKRDFGWFLANILDLDNQSMLMYKITLLRFFVFI